MVDKISVKQRSELMSRIRNKNTKPEMLVRKTLYSMGYRYRIHYNRLPGHPDIVMTKLKKVIFVHGCFWHCHKNCIEFRAPKSRLDFWMPKLTKNQKRDEEVKKLLHKDGWKVLIIWECETQDISQLKIKLKKKLRSN